MRNCLKDNGISWITLVVFFCVGFSGITLTLHPLFPEHHLAFYADKGKVKLLSRICSNPEQSGIATRYLLSVERIAEPGKTMMPVSGKMTLTVYKDPPELFYGDRVQLTAPLRSIRNFNNPGGFNYVRFQKTKGIEATAWVKGDSIVRLPENGPAEIFTRIIRIIHDFREDFSKKIDQVVSDPDAAAILNAMITGKRDAIGPDLETVFSKTGSSHLLAISGLHLSILAALFFYCFNTVLSLSKFLLVRGWSGKCAALLTLFPLIAYAILSGLAPSTRRALIMIMIFMFSHVADKDTAPLNSLAAAAMVILAIEPGSLYAVSFQLSFSAVLSIILGVSLLQRCEAVTSRNLKGKILVFIGISFFAMIGTQPLVMYYFNMVSLSGLLVNCMLVPIVGFVALPLGLAALFLYPVSSPLSMMLLRCSGSIVTPCITGLEKLADTTFTWTRTVTPDTMEILCYYLFLFSLFLFLKHQVKWGMVTALSVFLCFSFHGFFQIRERFFNPSVSVTVLDVGQGNSALIELPLGKRILVDGGGFSSWSSFDPGRYIVAPFLWQKKIMTLDGIILTHPESDHMNGLVHILENFTVKHFIKNQDQGQSQNYRSLMDLLKIKQCRIDIVPITTTDLNINEVRLLFLHPELDPGNLPSERSLNNNSLVFKLIYKNFSLLFPGDIMEETEKELADNQGAALASTLLIAPHHGSSTSSSNFFLDQVRPESVIISCGWNNRYGFPHEQVLKSYSRRGITIKRTDIDGAVRIISDGYGYGIMTSTGG